MQKNEIGLLLSLYHTLVSVSKWIKDLHIITKSVKLLEENMGGNFMTLDLAGISCI